jgi:hypothetical protein
VLAGEHPASAAEAGGHLVEDQQDSVPVAQLPHVAQVALRMNQHPGGSLHERLQDHGGHLVAVLGQQALHVGGVARLRRERVEEQRPVERVEEVDPSHRDRADRVPVVGVAQRDEAGPPGILAAGLLPVLERHLERDLGRGRAGVGVEDAGQAGRGELHQPFRQLDRRRVAEPEHGRVGDAVELGPDGAVDVVVAVAVHVAPQRGDAVDVAPAIGVDQVGALGALHDQRRLLLPAPLLREGVPEVRAVGGDEVHARRQ